MDVARFMRDYWDSYNAGDYEKTVLTYYTDDAVFVMPELTLTGRKGLIDEWVPGHRGLKEFLRVNNVIIQGNRVAIEVVAEMEFLEDRPDYPLGPGKAGDKMHLKMGVFYELRDNGICRAECYNFARFVP